jgi:AcrR family transcriptional regulator
MARKKRVTGTIRRRQIIEKATELFSQLGFERTTTAHLAAACKISEPGLYRYFQSKGKLYSEVLKSLAEKINTSELEREIETQNDVEKILYSISQHLLNTYTSHPELSRLLLFCSLEGHPMTKKVLEIIRLPYINILSRALARLKRKNLIKPVNPLITAGCFTGMATECALGANLWKGMQGREIKPEKTLKNTIPIFACGLKK